ncbi:MAG: hypothetical protein QM500_19745 [Methylococcales bacterium]
MMICRIIKVVIIVAISTDVYALDTTHTHSIVTSKIADLLKTSDSTVRAYEEIYQQVPVLFDGVPEDQQRLYWGIDFDQRDFPSTGTITAKEDYLLDLDAKPYTRYNNVIDGVIQEDMPATKVLKHFYQAESSEGLGLVCDGLTCTDSATIAMTYFNKSIEMMSGYDTVEEVATTFFKEIDFSAKQHAFFIFGQALHHVEDMSSPAHIHNDSHLVSGDEKDDYEGWYLPFLKISDDVNLSRFFTDAGIDSETVDSNTPLPTRVS